MTITVITGCAAIDNIATWQEDLYSTATDFATSEPVPTATPETPGIIIIDPSQSENPFSLESIYLDSPGWLVTGLSPVESKEKIIELGAGEDLAKLEKIYSAELIRSGANAGEYFFEAKVWETQGVIFWNSVVQNLRGQYMGIKFVKENAKIISSSELGLANYINLYSEDEDFFNFFLLDNPVDFPNASQKALWYTNGEIGRLVVGLFSNDILLGWYKQDGTIKGGWTELVDKTELNKQEIVIRINKFLNSEGELSDENLSNKIMLNLTPHRGSDDLGIFYIWYEMVSIQGVVLGEIEKNNDVWIFFGTKMGNSGERVVIPIKIMMSSSFPPEINDYNFRNLHVSLLNTTYHLENNEQALRFFSKFNYSPIIVNYAYNHPNQFYHYGAEYWRDSACDFYPGTLPYGVLPSNVKCGSGYKGVLISSEVTFFDDNWLINDFFLPAYSFNTFTDQY